MNSRQLFVTFERGRSVPLPPLQTVGAGLWLESPPPAIEAARPWSPLPRLRQCCPRPPALRLVPLRQFQSDSRFRHGHCEPRLDARSSRSPPRSSVYLDRRAKLRRPARWSKARSRSAPRHPALPRHTKRLIPPPVPPGRSQSPYLPQTRLQKCPAIRLETANCNPP